MSRKEAFLASEKQIVLHYGEGVQRVHLLAEILRERGFPAMAFAGGKPNQVSLFVGHGIYGPYDQNDVDDGALGGHAITFFQERIGAAQSP